MGIDEKSMAVLIAKDAIRDLAMLYSRGVDRKDIDLLRTLYAKDATDYHGKFFSGSAEGYLEFLETSLPQMPMSGHFICNHLISVDNDRGEGEVYALAYHLIADGKGGLVEDFKAVRYVDRYCKQNGRWLFAHRVVTFDLENVRPASPASVAAPPAAAEPSYTTLTSRLFERLTRA